MNTSAWQLLLNPMNSYSSVIQNNDMNSDSQNSPITYTPSTGSRTGTSQNVFTPQSWSSFPQSPSVRRPWHLAQLTSEAVGLHYHGPMQSNDLDNIIQTPAEATTHEQILALVTGVSPNYQGNPNLRANQAANIPDELNTSVWITNLPPHLDHKMLLDSVRNCGKIYAAVVNGPEHGHITSASKLVFFEVSGAQNLLRQYSEGSFLVGSYMPRVCYNRIKTEAKPPTPASRVLHIEGPSVIVNQVYLANLFRSDGITWQDEAVIVLSRTSLITRLEWRFGSYRCQAESARYLIERMKRRERQILREHELWQRVTVHFGVDPCAPQPGK
ncbi:hypothetical protein F5Y08DRAFT_320414 [Xylaria arbuscula]|nr:hypothetical protein F5Y08DRAFT_320414 [Xylaria arbuscula]